jgi:hypothetical protein
VKGCCQQQRSNCLPAAAQKEHLQAQSKHAAREA